MLKLSTPPRRGCQGKSAAEAVGRPVEVLHQERDDGLDLAACALPIDVEHRHAARGVRVQGEFGVQAEVAAATTTAGPEQAFIRPFGQAVDPAVCGDHLGGDEIVAADPEETHVEADAAAQQEACDADRGAAAVGHHAILRPQHLVEIAVLRTAAGGHLLRGGIPADRVHGGHVDHQIGRGGEAAI